MTMRQRAKKRLGPGVDENSTLVNASVDFATAEVRAERDGAAAMLRRLAGDWALAAMHATSDEQIDMCGRLHKSLSEAAGLIDEGLHRNPDPLALMPEKTR